MPWQQRQIATRTAVACRLGHLAVIIHSTEPKKRGLTETSALRMIDVYGHVRKKTVELLNKIWRRHRMWQNSSMKNIRKICEHNVHNAKVYLDISRAHRFWSVYDWIAIKGNIINSLVKTKGTMQRKGSEKQDGKQNGKQTINNAIKTKQTF